MAALAAMRVVAGVWVTAVLVAAASLVGLLAGWAAIEARVFPRSHTTVTAQFGPRRAGRSDHVAFARALAAVAAAYLAHCEEEEQER
jgi:hypothetical protein